MISGRRSVAGVSLTRRMLLEAASVGYRRLLQAVASGDQQQAGQKRRHHISFRVYARLLSPAAADANHNAKDAPRIRL